jgi:hypothetical protein
MAVTIQRDWPRAGVHRDANGREPTTRKSRHFGEVLRTRLESTLVGCRLDISVMGVRAVGQPMRSEQISPINLLRPATTVATHLLCASLWGPVFR